jgi:hypothetical protein
MPLADATAINYLHIPFTAILAHLILKEPYGSAPLTHHTQPVRLLLPAVPRRSFPAPARSWVDAAAAGTCSLGVVLVVQATRCLHLWAPPRWPLFRSGRMLAPASPLAFVHLPSSLPALLPACLQEGLACLPPLHLCSHYAFDSTPPNYPRTPS